MGSRTATAKGALAVSATRKRVALADVNITPIGQGASVSEFIAMAVACFEARGLRCRVHALGTNVEGELAAILAAVREAHRVLHSAGVVRIVTRLVLTTRTDRAQSIQEKIRAVTAKLRRRRPLTPQTRRVRGRGEKARTRGEIAFD